MSVMGLIARFGRVRVGTASSSDARDPSLRVSEHPEERNRIIDR